MRSLPNFSNKYSDNLFATFPFLDRDVTVIVPYRDRVLERVLDRDRVRDCDHVRDRDRDPLGDR